MFSGYPGQTRDTKVRIPFPNDPASPRTILTPPTNPQTEMALHVDATRISLGKYEIEQDLTFSIRIQNAVADDVSVELVRIGEGKETVYEVKIRKKDPNGMRVRNGIVPYTYVPPFSSISSYSSYSSPCSTPVTTPPLEVPPFHQYGSYFPPQYMSGGTWRTPRRSSNVSRGARSVRSSTSTIKTPIAGTRHSTRTSTFDRNSIIPLVANTTETPGAQYESDADDYDDDNASFLDHYGSRDAVRIPTPTSSPANTGLMQPDHKLYGKSAFTTDDDTAEEGDRLDEAEAGGLGSAWRKRSHWSDTEGELELELGIEGDQRNSKIYNATA